jgi:hypothetical protein
MSVPSSGQTFPLHSKGLSANSYITNHQAEIMYVFLGLTVISALLGFLLQNLNGINGPPPAGKNTT